MTTTITLEHIIYKTAITRKLKKQPRVQQHLIVRATNVRDGWVHRSSRGWEFE